MTEAAHLLKLIENVNAEDNSALDEIDAWVWCFLSGFKFQDMSSKRGFVYLHVLSNGMASRYNKLALAPKYTRSRDALKGIRPEGWRLTVFSNCFRMSRDGYVTFCTGYKVNSTGGFDKSFSSADFETEELAELHAIIQAIDRDKTTKEGD